MSKDNIENLGQKGRKYIAKKRMRNKEIIKIILQNSSNWGLQNFSYYENLNLVEIKLDANKVLFNLSKHKKGNCKYHFLVVELLFSWGIKNNASMFL